MGLGQGSTPGKLWGISNVEYSYSIPNISKDYYCYAVHSQLAKMKSEYVALLVLTSPVMGCLGIVPGYCNCLALFYSQVKLSNTYRPVGRGGVRGGLLELPFGLQKILYTVHFKCLTV